MILMLGECQAVLKWSCFDASGPRVLTPCFDYFNYFMPSGAHDLFLVLAVPSLLLLIVFDLPSSSLVNQSIGLNHITHFLSYISPYPSILQSFNPSILQPFLLT